MEMVIVLLISVGLDGMRRSDLSLWMSGRSWERMRIAGEVVEWLVGWSMFLRIDLVEVGRSGGK